MWRPLLVLVVLGLVLPVEYSQAGAASGSISGVVFHDRDGDSVRDAGEPGLAGRNLVLSRDGNPIASISSAEDGPYRFDNVQPGSYVLQVVAQELRNQCDDTHFVFNPYVQSYCANFRLPWTATRPDSVPVMVGVGTAVIEDFGAQPADVAVIGGIALLEDGRAQAGTLIEAVFNGQECGTASATSEEAGLNFLIEVLGANERAGCPAEGDPYRFRIGGVAAAEVRFYEPFEQTDARLQLQPLSAIRQHSWLWAEHRTTDPPSGTIVEALVEGTLCGSVEVEYAGQEVGFANLLVASDELIDGCGSGDATISFRTASLDGATTLPWEPDVREMSPRFYGDVNCNYGASSLDALFLLQLSGATRTGLPCPEGSDVNGSGATDVIDAALVLQFSAGLVERLPSVR